MTYEAAFIVDDYRHNCAEAVAAGLFVGERRVGAFKGHGEDGWVTARATFTAAELKTRVGISFENDACCRCGNSCSPSCSPLYNDLNLYVDQVVLEPAMKVAR